MCTKVNVFKIVCDYSVDISRLASDVATRQTYEATIGTAQGLR